MALAGADAVVEVAVAASDIRPIFECSDPPMSPFAAGMAVPPKVFAILVSEEKVSSGVLAEP